MSKESIRLGNIFSVCFSELPEIEVKEIRENALEVMNLRYFIDLPEGKKETSFKQLCRRVSRTVAAQDINYRSVVPIQSVENAIYNDMISHRFLFNSPALFSSGVGISSNPELSKFLYEDNPTIENYLKIIHNKNKNQMMFACFTISVPDSIEGIFDSVKNAAVISKFGGGVGANFGNLREKNALIAGGCGGKASGPISFMQTWNTMGSVVVQGGKRRAALMGMLNSDHPDIEEFIESKTKDGNLSYFNISVAIDNKFMEAVFNDGEYELISPEDNRIVGSVKARDLWDKICTAAHKRGDPGIFFIDVANNDNLLKCLPEYYIETTNPCVTGDTLVATPEGYKYAKDLDIGDNIVTVNGVGKIKNKEINENLPVYKVTFSDGGYVKCTASHQFQAIKLKTENSKKYGSKKWSFISLKDLAIGDYIRIAPSYIPDNKINTHGMDEFDFGLLLGILLGDGIITENAINKKHIKISLGYDEEDWCLFIEKVLTKYNINYSIFKDGHVISININGDNVILEILKDYNIIGYSYDKEIPLEIINSNINILKGLIDGYFSTDGNVNLKTNHPSIRLTSCNKKLVENVRIILNMFNIQTNYHIDKREFGIIQSRMCNARDKHTLIISGNSMLTFINNINMSNINKKTKLNEASINYSLTGNTWKARIVSIEEIGTDTVYDFYEPETDTWLTNGYVSRGCGEQPLPNETSCNLGSINLEAFVKDGKFDYDEFRNQVLRAVYYLDLVIDATSYPLDIIEKRTKSIRPIGLGLMGLADACIELGIKYGSEEFIQFCDNIGKILASESLIASAGIADIKGPFDFWYKVKEMLDGCMDELVFLGDIELPSDIKFSEYIENRDDALLLYKDLVKQMQCMMSCPEIPISFKMALKSAYEEYSRNEDGKVLFSALLNSIFNGKGLRNSRRLSIAPTGTISLLLNTSSSIEPNFAYEWTRTVTVGVNEKKDLKYHHKLYTVKNLDAGLLISAHELTPMQHAEVVKVFAPYIDSAISKTVNLPSDATVKDVEEVYEYCYRNKIKGITIYRDGSRDEQPLKKEDKKDIAINEAKNLEVPIKTPFKPVVESSVKERPKIMHGVTTKSDSPYGSIYVTANFDDSGKMFETFISAGKSGSVSKSVTEAFSRVISLALRSGVKIDDIIKTISNISGSDIWVYDTLDGQEVIVKSIPDASGKMLQDLNEYYKHLMEHNFSSNESVIDTMIEEKQQIIESFGHVKTTCPECGAKMIPASGCAVCTACGFSDCR
jgi:ribonucleotide reductase alpha subunit